MKRALFAPMIFAFLTLFILIIFPNSWIESIIPKERVSEAATELNPFMFQGKYVQNKMLQDDRYLPIYGSSELARLDRFHPSNYFAENDDGFTPFLIGRGGSISIIHFLNFAEHIDQLKGKKLVFIISPQWFKPKGADLSHFVPNFSILQGYDLAFNNKIDPEVKKTAIKRLLKFKPVQDDLILSALYQAEISSNPSDKRKADLARPFAYVYRSILEKKDLYYTLVSGISRKRDISSNVRDKSWEELKHQANVMGKRESTNNHFYIIDSKYNAIKHLVPFLKDTKIGASYGKSVEYLDFQLVLDLLKQSGAKPLFISVPVNGTWYDYTGFPKQGRTAYYKRIKQQIEAEGFPIADFSDHEYDPYFMKDTIHIGWKGWVYVDKAIKDFYDANI
ncbi:D-alanyl-lipoteichoic acid biosynthesis protein DltD [Bacillus sp. S/N-304-OC-R1]|uniref:D-alanyl-lipoteichoic acid biosynthesis protein DltD n=1 Tax=Bacillus sp. S/N-304-OC-R1 TaxID=2758034 RepID=UPI001C8E387B|nr:D-alanyl-lipoteichoic acid biosynthesis protein DltD [Bacillus sp. S/N-304-OC-R1]MBY0122813.1 D-alanyl-lipoteichoic acid biosynthesis protein DltD [Bacillus sp. S/N-304-OC-R1]